MSWDRIRLYKAKSVRLGRLSFAQIGSSLVARSGADAHPRGGALPDRRARPGFVGKADAFCRAPYRRPLPSSGSRALSLGTCSSSPPGADRVSARVPRHANPDFSAFARRHVNGAAFMGKEHSAGRCAALPLLVPSRRVRRGGRDARFKARAALVRSRSMSPPCYRYDPDIAGLVGRFARCSPPRSHNRPRAERQDADHRRAACRTAGR